MKTAALKLVCMQASILGPFTQVCLNDMQIRFQDISSTHAYVGKNTIAFA